MLETDKYGGELLPECYTVTEPYGCGERGVSVPPYTACVTSDASTENFGIPIRAGRWLSVVIESPLKSSVCLDYNTKS